MFPYPSGAGLHVGHPLGYIASDIYSRYKRLKRLQRTSPDGLRRLRPACRAVRHPDGTAPRRNDRAEHRPLPRTARQDRLLVRLAPRGPHLRPLLLQMDAVGLSGDVHNTTTTAVRSTGRTDRKTRRRVSRHRAPRDSTPPARRRCVSRPTNGKPRPKQEREQILQNYRLAFRADTMVNWCPQLGTVLANDEVKDGLSERGGYPVEQKRMKQWLLRVTAYAQRMLDGLEQARVERLAEGDPAQLDRPFGRRAGLLRHPGLRPKNSRYSPRVPTRSSA